MAKLENVVNSIRDILRKEGITGIDSAYHCIVFIINRLLDNVLCDKLNVDKKYTFENIMKNDEGDEIGNQELFGRVYNGTKECLVGQIMFKMGFKNIKFKLEGTVNLKQIYKKLQELDINNLDTQFDLIGTIYELHLKSGSSHAMRDLGQYYTNRNVIEYMVKLCDPKIKKDGTIEKIVDPTMGSGGFLTIAIRYIIKQYGVIDWKKNKDNIVGFDIDENVKNMALVNVLLETGELHSDTLCKQDTLRNDMMFKDGKYDGKILETADIILANEPMGLKNIVHASCCDRIKNLKMRGTKAEPLFLQLFMSALNDGGRCAVIVPDGVLFNDSNLHRATRQYLIENFNLKKVVAMNDAFFLNTGVKTSILFFAKDGNKINEVEFCEIRLKENKIEETCIVKVNYDKIKEYKYSLFVNKYNVVEIENVKDVEYKKLGDVCDFINGYAFKSSKYVNDGIPIVTIKHIPFDKEIDEFCYYEENSKYDKYKIANGDVLVALTGATIGKIGIYNKNQFSYLNQRVAKITAKPEIAMNKYVYYYMLVIGIQDKIKVLSSGSAQENISTNALGELIEIPIPHITIQLKIVDQLDVLCRDIEQTKKMIEDKKQIIKMYLICNTMESQTINFIEICKFEQKTQKMKASDGANSGKYKFYTSSQEKVMWCDECEFSDNYFIILGRGGNPSIHIDTNFSISHDDCYVISSCCNIKYIYYNLLCNKNKLEEGFTGSTIKHISKQYINDLDIKLPSIEKQNEIVEYCDDISNTIRKLEEHAEKNKILMKQIMTTYLGNNNESTQSDDANIQFNRNIDECISNELCEQTSALNIEQPNADEHRQKKKRDKPTTVKKTKSQNDDDKLCEQAPALNVESNSEPLNVEEICQKNKREKPTHIKRTGPPREKPEHVERTRPPREKPKKKSDE